MLHVHAYIPLRHTGYLTFNANQLRDYAEIYFGHKVHINAPIGRNSGFDWQTYINKSVDL